MWARIKKNGFWILIAINAFAIGSNIYLVGDGWVSQNDNWFAMTLWAGIFYCFWVSEMFATRALKKTLADMIDVGFSQTKLNAEILQDNIRMAMDNQALIEENQRLEKQNVIQFRERKND